jgi:hypothetical protein
VANETHDQQATTRVTNAVADTGSVESEPGRNSTFTIRVPRIVEVGKATQ